MIIDGRALAREALARAKARAAKLPRPPRVFALVASETPATKSYLAIKEKHAVNAGCSFEICRIETTSIHKNLLQQKIVDILKRICENADAVIVQLPLLDGIDTKAVCDAIPIEKDADVLSSDARAAFKNMDLRSPYLMPPVVEAIREIFAFANIEPKDKKIVVVGAGRLVGAPVAIWLARQCAAVETIATSAELIRARATLAQADIIVSGAGSPHIIKPEMLKQGVVLIDAGTSESGGAVIGDADPACADKCSIFTPVPGGVGPLSVACLFNNVVTLAERR